MEIQTERPLLFEWRFSGRKPYRSIKLVPLGADIIELRDAQDMLADDFESLTILGGERIKSVSNPNESV